MSTGTTANGYPFPNGDDPIANGDDVIKNLATAVDTKLRVSAGGIASASVDGVLTSPPVTVTLPSGRFAANPAVSVTGTYYTWLASLNSTPTKTSFTFRVSSQNNTVGGAGGTLSVHWIATAIG